jgi:hypothetical protein
VVDDVATVEERPDVAKLRHSTYLDPRLNLANDLLTCRSCLELLGAWELAPYDSCAKRLDPWAYDLQKNHLRDWASIVPVELAANRVVHYLECRQSRLAHACQASNHVASEADREAIGPRSA